MARERWFFAESGERRGPLAIGPLLSALVQDRDPRAVLVWRRGFAEWTRAEDIPEIEQRLAPLLARPTGPLRRGSARATAPSAAAARATQSARPMQRLAVLGLGVGAALVLLFAGLGAWRLAARPEVSPITLPPAAASPGQPASSPALSATPPPVAPRNDATPVPARASGTAAAVPATASRPRATPARSALVADAEASLPPAELRKLRGVAGWSGENLKLTVYNGTSWRVTELSVRVERFVGDEFVYDGQPLRLLPPAGAVDSGVADLLQRVAPDRKKPGLNPLDTGAFVARAGARPENMRWEIESARGYPPASSPRQ